MPKVCSDIARYLAVSLVTIFLITAPLAAQDRAAIRTTVFSDNGGLLVQAPSFEITKMLAKRIAFALQYTLDRVNIPPVRGIAGIPLPSDAVTGASRPAGDSQQADGKFVKNRNEVTASFSMPHVDAVAYLSAENDYVGRLLGAGVNWDFNQKNTNLAIGGGYAWDSISPAGRDTIFTKLNYLANITLTQVLSKISIMRVGVDISHQDGYQVNPYRTVFVNGGYYLETHPLVRTRVAGFARLNTYIKPADAAVWLYYRIYGDDWGVQSHTLGVKFYQNLSERLLVRYRYRFYTQTAAYFYQENYPLAARPVYFTADYKLMAFHSHLFGFQFAYQAPFLQRWLAFAEQPTLEFKLERFFTSRNFGANILQLGLSLGF